jgi:dipeptidase D
MDDAGNVLIRKPAAPGMEDRVGVVLQGHMDMVPQKDAGKEHDFETDPIDAYVEGDWVTADGTTLGGDDGIGVAIIMAVLQSKELAVGPIEALFTVNEEDGMSGALGLEPGVLSGGILINIDQETEGEFLIGSAGGEVAGVRATYPQVDVPPGLAAVRLDIDGLKGGHSGINIDKGRANAAKLMAQLLDEASEGSELYLSEIVAGTAGNAIPREATALVAAPTDQLDAFYEFVSGFESGQRSEFSAVEPDLRVRAEAAELPAQVMDRSTSGDLITALQMTPQGVVRMSDAVPGLVDTSTNLGVVRAQDGELEIVCDSRSTSDGALDEVGGTIADVWAEAGYDVEFTGRYPGWAPDPDSEVLALMRDVYQDLFGQEPEVAAIHAGLECGTIGANYPGLDMISIGPTLQDVHTSDERLEIPSVSKVTELLFATLERIPKAEEEPESSAGS